MLEICVGIIGNGTHAEAQKYPWCARFTVASTTAARNAFDNTSTMHGDRERNGESMPAEYAIRSSARNASADEGSREQSLLS
jgi:hypothetical protein